MGLHIGKLIGERLTQIGMTKSEFARRINKARQNVNDILKRQSIDTELLFSISKALNYDFFQHYVKSLNEEVKINEPANEGNLLSEQVVEYQRQVTEQDKKLSMALKEVELLNEIVSLLKKQLKEPKDKKGM